MTKKLSEEELQDEYQTLVQERIAQFYDRLSKHHGSNVTTLETIKSIIIDIAELSVKMDIFTLSQKLEEYDRAQVKAPEDQL